MEDTEAVLPSIGDTPEREAKQSEVETLNPFLQSPKNLEDANTEVNKDENANLLGTDIVAENVELLESKSAIQLQEEKTDKMLLKNLYSKVIGSFVFVLNKVMIPFGEYILMNSTLWIILKSTLEVFLEMLLYIILAICYVFLKFISQIENKNKPKKNEEEPTANRTQEVATTL